MTLPDEVQIVAIVGASLGAARLLGEALRKIAEVTPSREDDRIAGTILRVVDGLGAVLAWVGLGNSRSRRT